jgi:hypothetical protein
MVAVSVPVKYIQKAGRELYEAFEEKERLLCHDCGYVWMGSFPAKCPECGCRKCVVTDEPLSEALNTMRTRSIRLLTGK